MLISRFCMDVDMGIVGAYIVSKFSSNTNLIRILLFRWRMYLARVSLAHIFG